MGSGPCDSVLTAADISIVAAAARGRALPKTAVGATAVGWESEEAEAGGSCEVGAGAALAAASSARCADKRLAVIGTAPVSRTKGWSEPVVVQSGGGVRG